MPRHFLLLLSALVFVVACQAAPQAGRQAQPVEDNEGSVEDNDGSASDRQDQASRPPGGNPAPTMVPRPIVGGIRTEVVAEGLILPSNLAWAPDGRLFMTEVSLGRVRIMDKGQVLPEPFLQVDPASRPENGLLGLVLDQDFARTRYVYVYYTETKGNKPLRNRVLRYTDSGGRGADPKVIIDDLPVSNWRFNGGHNGGRMAFGRDGKLYVTTGNAGVEKAAQDMNRLNGKMLRLNPDGTIPADNPFPGSPIYALGLRNAWGLGFHPLTGVLYVSENGDIGHDELNRIVAGGNYGSPVAAGIARDPRFLDPFWETGAESGGIAGMAFYTGDLFPQYKNDLLTCMWNAGRLLRVKLGGPNYDQVEQEDVLSDQCYLDVLTGPDGAIYISNVTKILRLVPEQ